jgi:hypothetical protein
MSATNTPSNTAPKAAIQPPDLSLLFSMYDKVPARQCVTCRDSVNPVGGQESSLLSMAYFSPENMTIVQNGIRAGVYRRSNGQYTIGEQNCEPLKIIMRSIFLQSAMNLPDNIPKQIQALNKLVIDECVTSVYSEAIGYLKYLRDASTLAVPMALPTAVSEVGTKTEEFKGWMGGEHRT